MHSLEFGGLFGILEMRLQYAEKKMKFDNRYQYFDNFQVKMAIIVDS